MERWGISVEGVDEVLRNLNNKLGSGRRNRISREAINYAAEFAENDLKEVTGTFQRTGRTTQETTHSEARKIGSEFFQAKVGWGAGSRWRLEHLNEFGFTKYGKTYPPNGSIRGFGKLRQYAEAQQAPFAERMREKLEELAR
jgi:hypothetical protein|nr:MAG TPA: tail component [Caudoviricetes sp.]